MLFIDSINHYADTTDCTVFSSHHFIETPCYYGETVISCFPPFNLILRDCGIGEDWPSTVTWVPFPGRTAIPDVPSGVSSAIVIMSAAVFDDDDRFQLAPNHPIGVVNPPSAALRPERCGAKDQVDP